MKILWVEDEPEAMKYFRYALENDGHEVRFAETIDEVRSALAAGFEPDMTLVDIMMPTGKYDAAEADFGMGTGLLVAKEIRESNPEMKIVLVTNRTGIAPPDALGPDVRVLYKPQMSPRDFAKVLTQSFHGG